VLSLANRLQYRNHDAIRVRSIRCAARRYVDLKLCDANAKDLPARLLAVEAVIYAVPGAEPDEQPFALFVSRGRRVYFRELNLSELKQPPGAATKKDGADDAPE
jgi:hypothetical protein